MYIVAVMIRQLIKEYFSFTLKERVAVIVLIGSILIIYLIPQFLENNTQLPAEKEIEEFRKLEQQLAQPRKGRENDSEGDDDRMAIHTAVSTYEDSRPAQLFYFDPNLLDEPGWRRLGLRDKTIGTILKYRAKGGRFYKPEDLKKIYGLPSADYERLASFIRIDPGKNEVARQSYEKYGEAKHDVPRGRNTYREHNTYITEKYSREPMIIDINVADTSAFISLPGIGSKLAARIVHFRERLGGFYDVAQLAETYGLQDSTFQKIKAFLKLSGDDIKKIDINTAGVEILKQHPYIKWNIARAIVAYREQHGAFKNLEELLQIGVISNDALQKMLPYISLGQ